MVQAGATAACYEADYSPFGGEGVITNTCPQNYKFTGKERDGESGLDYFLARHYSSTIGRFLQPDEFVGGPVDAFSSNDPLPPGPLPYADITNPQSLNKYTYTYNNPLRYVDPNGHYVESAWDATSLMLGIHSYVSNVQQGNVGSAILDAVGVVVDTAALATPLVPGGAGAALKAARAADKLDDVVDVAETGKKGGHILEAAAKGKAGEEAVEAELKAEGAEILGKQVTAQTQEGTRRMDFLVDQGGGPKAVEVKSGNATRNRSQRLKDESMANQGGRLIGKNAPKDLRNKTINLETEVRKPKT
jgi:RHS repeat-associated protein